MCEGTFAWTTALVEYIEICSDIHQEYRHIWGHYGDFLHTGFLAAYRYLGLEIFKVIEDRRGTIYHKIVKQLKQSQKDHLKSMIDNYERVNNISIGKFRDHIRDVYLSHADANAWMSAYKKQNDFIKKEYGLKYMKKMIELAKNIREYIWKNIDNSGLKFDVNQRQRKVAEDGKKLYEDLINYNKQFGN